MLAIAIVACGITVDAKTSKKKSKSRTSQTIRHTDNSPVDFGASLFLKKDNSLVIFKPGSGIESNLQKLGFSKSGHNFSKDGIKVKMEGIGSSKNFYPTVITIKFNNNQERDNFISETKAFGLEWDGLDCINGWEKTTSFSVEDKSIQMTLIP